MVLADIPLVLAGIGGFISIFGILLLVIGIVVNELPKIETIGPVIIVIGMLVAFSCLPCAIFLTSPL